MPGAPHAPLAPTGVAFDYCAICAVISLASTLVPPGAPQLPLPAFVYTVQMRAEGAIILVPSPHILFLARAPPVA